ncbi:MAG: tripartite tricarboxylate transporter substrate binding protein [Betaproteobacteria bacterium]|nr:tripartite tricarboxylate transporter substrate binding protein [Betaproteobacteria bacterium]
MTHFVAAMLLGFVWAALPAGAQTTYPARPVHMVVPYSPGGGTDIVARIIAQKLTEAWGQQVVVENRAGASGMIAGAFVSKAAPDGHTLLMGYTGDVAINQSLFKKMTFDPVKNFTPVALAAIAPMIFVVHPSLPIRDVKQVIALAKARPGQVVYASAGIGQPGHLAFELLQHRMKIELTHVPYKGGAPAVTDLVGGHVMMFFSGIMPAIPHVRSGRLRALAVSTSKRSPVSPEVPTMIEAGMPGFDLPTWYGVLAPAGTPRDVVAKLSAEISRSLALADVKERLLREGADPAPGSPEQFAQFIQTEVAKYAMIIREAGVRAD